MSTGGIRLWQLISPSLPVGAYSYSQGLEYVVEAGGVTDERAARQWIGGLLEHGLGRMDLAVLARVHRAWRDGDAARVECWSRLLIAMRETSELRAEDLGMGAALARLLGELGVRTPSIELPFAGAFAIAAAHWSISAADACAGFAWAWCEAQVAAAVKLVPLGHTAGQRVLLDLGGRIDAAVAEALALEDEEVGASLTGFALASARHETQYTRLFRS